MNSRPERFTLDELCKLVDLPKRTIRYYIQLGLVRRPEGARRGAYYVRRHLEELLEVQKWQKAGLSLERIRDLLGGAEGEGPLPPPQRRKAGDVEVWSHLVVREGVEIHIEPRQADLTPGQLRAFSRGVIELMKQVKAKETGE